LQVCAANYAALRIFVETFECCGTFARCGCASIGDVHEIHEVAKNRAARRRDCCRHLIVGCTGGIRARRLRSQPPSQCVWPMRMGRSTSTLVPENYGPSRYLRGRWSVALLQVIAFGAARGGSGGEGEGGRSLRLRAGSRFWRMTRPALPFG
jgi:hypothetical protein